ncbi:MAG: hypothetical protein Q4E99_00435 [Bacillota bacterium]|nr:hypothetical protein [Bacillota bacterium]
MKKVTIILITLVVIFCSMSSFTYKETVKYLDSRGTTDQLVELECTNPQDLITSVGMHGKLSRGTYIVRESCTIGEMPNPPFEAGGIGISEDVHIIICDGVTLTVNGGFSNTGYKRDNTGILYLHGVKNGQCKVIINGLKHEKECLGENYANGYGVELSRLNIYGCDVTITGHKGLQGKAPLDASGKDGYSGVYNTELTIYNGNVTVIGGDGGDSAEKSGTKCKNDGGTGADAIQKSIVTVMGGTLTMKGGNGGTNLYQSNGSDGNPGKAIDSSTRFVNDSNVKFIDCATNDQLKSYYSARDHKDVLVKSNQNLQVATAFSNAPNLLLIGLSVVLIAIVIVILRRKKSKKRIT